MLRQWDRPKIDRDRRSSGAAGVIVVIDWLVRGNSQLSRAINGAHPLPNHRHQTAGESH
jgi:hypothetical protein